MKGETLRNRLKTIEIRGQKIFLTEVADGLGITLQAFYSKLKAKRLDDEFIQQIADVLKVDVSVLKEGTVSDSDIAYITKPKTLEENINESIELVDDMLRPEKAKNMTDEELELFTAHKLSLLKLAKALAKRNEKKP